jgi:hypothetical protein
MSSRTAKEAYRPSLSRQRAVRHARQPIYVALDAAHELGSDRICMHVADFADIEHEHLHVCSPAEYVDMLLAKAREWQLAQHASPLSYSCVD